MKQQPSIAAQQELRSIDTNGKTVVKIPRSKDSYKIGWMKPYTQDVFTDKILKAEIPKESTDAEVASYAIKKWKLHYKLASYIILNNIWKIKLFHWIFWRWLYLIKQYDDEQLLEIIMEGKKKVNVVASWSIIVLADLMMSTTMFLTKEEVGQSHQEHTLALKSHLEKNSLGQ